MCTPRTTTFVSHAAVTATAAVLCGLALETTENRALNSLAAAVIAQMISYSCPNRWVEIPILGRLNAKIITDQLATSLLANSAGVGLLPKSSFMWRMIGISSVNAINAGLKGALGFNRLRNQRLPV